jgi:hypothetical protein
MGNQRGLDLAQLNPEPAHLHLVIGPPDELQLAARVPAGHVPGAVHALSGRAERIGDKTLGRERSPSEVAPGGPMTR